MTLIQDANATLGLWNGTGQKPTAAPNSGYSTVNVTLLPFLPADVHDTFRPEKNAKLAYLGTFGALA
jgi:hypothetical protein